ncbi:MAG TPA: YciI family protein [Bradyrhizobium sp.]|nr:YciI family protein [Bradyrhizobium sp.]
MSAPTPKEIIELSKERGYLAKQLYVIFTTPANGIAPVLENLQRHLDYQESLEQRGVMFAAGPHWSDDEQRWEGDGMVVVRAGSLAEAEAIAKDDPMHASGARRYRVRAWLVNEGTMSIKLNFASGTFELA